MGVDRDSKGRFPKGKSGNPKGRPKKYALVERLAREALEYGHGEDGEARGNKALDCLVKVMTGDLEPHEAVTKDGDVVEVKPECRPGDRSRAAEILLSYAYGKPKQQVDLDTPEDSPFARMVLYIPDNGRGSKE